MDEHLESNFIWSMSKWRVREKNREGGVKSKEKNHQKLVTSENKGLELWEGIIAENSMEGSLNNWK